MFQIWNTPLCGLSWAGPVYLPPALTSAPTCSTAPTAFCAAAAMPGPREFKVSPSCFLKPRKTELCCWHSRGTGRTLLPWKCTGLFQTLPSAKKYCISLYRKWSWTHSHAGYSVSQDGVKSGWSPQKEPVMGECGPGFSIKGTVSFGSKEYLHNCWCYNIHQVKCACRDSIHFLQIMFLWHLQSMTLIGYSLLPSFPLIYLGGDELHMQKQSNTPPDSIFPHSAQIKKCLDSLFQ